MRQFQFGANLYAAVSKKYLNWCKKGEQEAKGRQEQKSWEAQRILHANLMPFLIACVGCIV